MPIDRDTWGLTPVIVSAAEMAYEHRGKIAGLWQRIADHFKSQKRSIAFTGRAGVGKTVLFDYLRGTAYARGYMPPLPSEAVETGIVKAPGLRIDLSVVPGDPSTPRREALADLFTPDDPVDGVVHVVSNGFVELRSEYSSEVGAEAAKPDAIEKFRKHQKRLELEDLGETCEAIRDAIRRSKQPSWVIVAVTKIDLFYAELAKARDYYSPRSKGAFAKRLRKLQGQVGSDNFRWTVVPVCAVLKDFTWSNQTVTSTLDERARDEYIQNFANTLERFCGRTD